MGLSIERAVARGFSRFGYGRARIAVTIPTVTRTTPVITTTPSISDNKGNRGDRRDTRDRGGEQRGFRGARRGGRARVDTDDMASLREHWVTPLTHSIEIDVIFWSSTFPYLQALGSGAVRWQNRAAMRRAGGCAATTRP